ncbi:stage III sporulation protein AF [Paenibacillus sp. CF384]|uniref:stage III sporulation protein AF n=1 Tax=Paenibacillus sp. CF384 TaxID=1884382 RepID=UPI00089956BA|nr:stage III sporulation protein AF [Paenibacillus sp. CF384]SDW33394.1 stage III sporulation protein AF [Paenibacillus sp. CF384]
MMNWLAVWLQQIIAVVLLAGFIDLLLPNKAMQRYVRLVAGLIILLTILTPIIRLLQGDFNAKLDAQVENWVHNTKSEQFHMPTLEDIQQNAKDLQRKQQSAATALTEQKLEAAMKTELAENAGLHAAAVDVKLELNQDGQSAQIAGVTVTLLPPEEQAAANAEQSDDAKAVDEVEAVEVTVKPESTSEGDRQSALDDSDTVEKEAPGAVTDAVKDVLRLGWGVAPRLIDVKVQQTAPDAAY